ncbi:MAG: hypothetical protein K1X74_04845 [Pirellulales bacterium]|nr:hypothetical protein [Pirellulales bacterium]
MPTFLGFYLFALLGTCVVAAVLYFSIGEQAGQFARSLFGTERGTALARSFRLMLVISCLIGGLSTQWYGCRGYSDYEAVAQDRRLMLQKTTEQIASAVTYGVKYLLGAGAVGTLMFAVLRRRHAAASAATSSDCSSRAHTTAAPRQPDRIE